MHMKRSVVVFLSFSSCWWKNETFPSRFILRFFPQQSKTQMSMFEDSVLKVVFIFIYMELAAPTSGSVIHPDRRYLWIEPFFSWLPQALCCGLNVVGNHENRNGGSHPCVTKALFFSIMEVVHVLVYKLHLFTTNSQYPGRKNTMKGCVLLI